MQPHRPDGKKLGGTRPDAAIVSHCDAASKRETWAVGATFGACPRRGVPVNQAPFHGRSTLRVVVPENLILAQTGASSGELAEGCAANNGESATYVRLFGPTIG